VTGNREQNTSELLQRILETVTWCKHKADVENPRTCLRTPELKPEEYAPDANGNLDFNASDCEQATPCLTILSQKRRELLQRANMSVESSSVNRNNGRFMLHILRHSLWCGLSEECSQGFIDVIDLPPWDTWLICVPISGVLHQTGLLLSWVPSEFCDLVSKGRDVNMVDCFFWASEYRQKGYSSDVLEWLESQGLLF
jgi:hypothetical protein